MTKITVSVVINSSLDKVWSAFVNPDANNVWNSGSPDWSTSNTKIDLRTGGKFSLTMSANDGSASFELIGIYSNVIPNSLIEYTLSDGNFEEILENGLVKYTVKAGRKVIVTFENLGDKVSVTEVFDAEDVHSLELQKAGWQGILNNLKDYVESL